MTTSGPDPRTNAYRDNMASIDLKGVVDAPRYVEGKLRQVDMPSLPLKRAPRIDAPLDTEVLFGERVQVFDEREGWAWAQCQRDSYVGYLPTDGLSETTRKPEHMVMAPATFLYPEPDIKRPPIAQLPMNARVTVKNITGEFAEIDGQGFIFAKHLIEENKRTGSITDIAHKFVGTPYLWGGRTYSGIDCSGLVQTAMHAAGFDCPRDTDMQENSIGQAVAHQAGVAELKSGDLIFWPGHVGIMVSHDELLHANAYHMLTVIEPYEEARLRIASSDTGDVRMIKRL